MMNESETYLSIEEVKQVISESVDKAFHTREMGKRNYQQIEIKTCEDSPVFAEICIGGQKIEGVRGWKLTQKAGDLPRLTLDINAMNLAIDERCVCFAEGWGEFAMKMIDPISEEMKKEGA